MTCSIHCERNFPFDKARSDWDVALPDGVGDEIYLETVNDTLVTAMRRFRPQLVLYVAGVDVYRHDPLGRLDVTLSGLRRREALVAQTVISAGVPLVTVLGGGYDDDRRALARRHAVVTEETMAVADRFGL